MAELAAMFDIRKVAFDRYHIDYLTPELDDEGLRFLWYRTAVDLVNRQSPGLLDTHSGELCLRQLIGKADQHCSPGTLSALVANAIIERR